VLTPYHKIKKYLIDPDLQRYESIPYGPSLLYGEFSFLWHKSSILSSFSVASYMDWVIQVANIFYVLRNELQHVIN